ncbi:head-tail connector protein [Sphingomonas bacterium]|uniref:head-tail connector protein n=1 Tax=Sphingomonas bacterium TaxID=1895847 RepID=UPI00157535ED|nr:head-tail connector protein [Sphingomonas bacterium]
MLATLIALGVIPTDSGTVLPPTPLADLEPLTLDEVKLNLRVDDTDEDTLIEGLITAARIHVEGYTGLVLTPRTVTETVPQLGRWVDLDSWPVTGVSAIRYPLSGVLTPMATGSWATSFVRRPVRLLPTAVGWGLGTARYGSTAWSLPTLPVEIDVQAGYATPADVPQTVKQAMQLLISHLYSNRAASEVGLRAAAIEIPFGVRELLQSSRLVRV